MAATALGTAFSLESIDNDHMPTTTIRQLTKPDLPAYKALRYEALRTSPEAFTSDYAIEVQKPATAYAPRLGDTISLTTSVHFLLGAFDKKGQLLGSIAL